MSEEKDIYAKEKIFFNLYVANEVAKMKNIRPEEINLDMFYRDCMTMSLKLAKEVYLYREALFHAEKNNNILPNEKECTEEDKKHIHSQIDRIFDKLTTVRTFMVSFYDIPLPPKNIVIQNEKEDDLEELRGNVKILRVRDQEDMENLVQEELNDYHNKLHGRNQN